MSEFREPQIHTERDDFHAVEWGWQDNEGGYMRITPPILLAMDRLDHTLENGAARLSSEEGEDVKLLTDIEPVVGVPPEQGVSGGGTLFWISVDAEKVPNTTLEGRNERARNVAKIFVAYAAAASSSTEFKKLF